MAICFVKHKLSIIWRNSLFCLCEVDLYFIFSCEAGKENDSSCNQPGCERLNGAHIHWKVSCLTSHTTCSSFLFDARSRCGRNIVFINFLWDLLLFIMASKEGIPIHLYGFLFTLLLLNVMGTVHLGANFFPSHCCSSLYISEINSNNWMFRLHLTAESFQSSNFFSFSFFFFK